MSAPIAPSTPPPRVPFRAAHPPRTQSAAQKLAPDLDGSVIDPLAHVWDEVVHRIICEMLELGDADQSPLHINIREEMILELAMLQLWLDEKVVEKRVADRDLAKIDLKQERRECLGPEGAEAITGTAKLAYEHMWSRFMEQRWKPKSAKAIERDSHPRQPKPAIKPVGKNHFIPRWFIRDNWSLDGKVVRWRRSDAGWTSAWRGFGKWGFRQNLYSDRIEAYLGLLEGDAKKPIEMLLQTRPLNGPQRVSLIGFLVVQILRSPFFIDALRDELVCILAELGYADDPDMALKAYETLYRNDEFYNKLAHPLMWSRWALVKAASPVFVLPDTFAARSELGDGLRLIAPLTPTMCFVTLPSRETEKRIVPLHLPVDDQLARRISSVLVRSAATEFLSHPTYRLEKAAEDLGLAEVLDEIEATIELRAASQS